MRWADNGPQRPLADLSVLGKLHCFADWKSQACGLCNLHHMHAPQAVWLQLGVQSKGGVETLAEVEGGVHRVLPLLGGVHLAQSVISTLIDGVHLLRPRLGHGKQGTNGKNGEALKASLCATDYLLPIKQCYTFCSDSLQLHTHLLKHFRHIAILCENALLCSQILLLGLLTCATCFACLWAWLYRCHCLTCYCVATGGPKEPHMPRDDKWRPPHGTTSFCKCVCNNHAILLLQPEATCDAHQFA